MDEAAVRDWLAALVEPFERYPDSAAVAGFFVPDTQTSFEIAMGATVLPDQSSSPRL